MSNNRTNKTTDELWSPTLVLRSARGRWRRWVNWASLASANAGGLIPQPVQKLPGRVAPPRVPRQPFPC
jgi:hypothetical protein